MDLLRTFPVIIVVMTKDMSKSKGRHEERKCERSSFARSLLTMGPTTVLTAVVVGLST